MTALPAHQYVSRTHPPAAVIKPACPISLQTPLLPGPSSTKGSPTPLVVLDSPPPRAHQPCLQASPQSATGSPTLRLFLVPAAQRPTFALGLRPSFAGCPPWTRCPWAWGTGGGRTLCP